MLLPTETWTTGSPTPGSTSAGTPFSKALAATTILSSKPPPHTSLAKRTTDTIESTLTDLYSSKLEQSTLGRKLDGVVKNMTPELQAQEQVNKKRGEEQREAEKRVKKARREKARQVDARRAYPSPDRRSVVLRVAQPFIDECNVWMFVPPSSVLLFTRPTRSILHTDFISSISQSPTSLLYATSMPTFTTIKMPWNQKLKLKLKMLKGKIRACFEWPALICRAETPSPPKSYLVPMPLHSTENVNVVIINTGSHDLD
ncbi:hypothetical protein F5146DRAFT_1130785 [Armillaria mellea]|nr:hypothetical protein F5146DRAFT_1130785 [Armillaria mellea]